MACVCTGARYSLRSLRQTFRSSAKTICIVVRQQHIQSSSLPSLQDSDQENVSLWRAFTYDWLALIIKLCQRAHPHLQTFQSYATMILFDLYFRMLSLFWQWCLECESVYWCLFSNALIVMTVHIFCFTAEASRPKESSDMILWI